MKPVKAIIKNLYGNQIGGCEKDTIEEVNEYLALIDAKERPWHQAKQGEYTELPFGAINYTEEEREIEPSRIEEQYELDENGDQITDKIVQIVIPAKTQKVYVVPKQYTVEIQDLTNDINYKNQVADMNRRKEMPPLEELTHRLWEALVIAMPQMFENGKLKELEDLRKAVKLKYPKI